MGVDITMVASYKDSRGVWNPLPVYVKLDDGTMEFARVYNGRNRELFDFLDGSSDYYGEMSYARRGFPVTTDDVPSAFMRLHEEWGGHDFGASWMTLEELRLLIHSMKKKITYYDENGESQKEKNQMRKYLKSIYDSVVNMIWMSNIYSAESDIRIYWWFDC